MNEFQDLSQFRLPKNFRGRSAVFVQMWWFVYSFLFRPSPQILYGWRRALLRLFGAKIGKHALIRSSAQITFPWKVSIGDYSWVGDDVVLYSLGEIRIGSNTVVSQRAYLCSGNHDYKSVAFEIFSKPIILEDQVWLASDVFVAPGVRVGFGSVVQARSSVFSDLPPGKICSGTPALPIKDRLTNARP